MYSSQMANFYPYLIKVKKKIRYSNFYVITLNFLFNRPFYRSD